jgi:hypothetical protein
MLQSHLQRCQFTVADDSDAPGTQTLLMVRARRPPENNSEGCGKAYN